MVAASKHDMGEMGRSAKVIATGGLAGLIADHTECVDIIDPNLTLDGLRMIYDLNRDERVISDK